MTNWGQKLDKICHNKRVRCDKRGQILSLQKYQFCKNMANTLTYQTIVTKFVTSGQKCDKIQTLKNRVVVRFLACVKNFVTSLFSLSRVCPHFVTPQNPIISTFVRVLTPNVTKFPKLLTIFLFFLKKFC